MFGSMRGCGSAVAVTSVSSVPGGPSGTARPLRSGPLAWNAGLISAIAYGLTPLVAVIGFAGGASPSVLVTLRGILATIAIAVFWAVFDRCRRVPIFPVVGLVALCGPLYGLQVVAFFASVQFGGAQVAVVVAHIYPILVIGLVWLRDRAPVTVGTWILAGTIVAGVGMVMVPGTSGASRIAVGLALVAATGYALYLVASERWVHEVGPVLSAGLVTVGATLTVGTFALARGETFAVAPAGWYAAALQGVFLLPLGLAAALYALRQLGSVPMSLLGMLEPIVGVVLAAVFLHERLSPLQCVGVGLVIIACATLPLASPER